MELRQLRYFVALAEELHFGRAAERLRISKPTLSQQVGVLERKMGVVLLHREPGRVTLSRAGEVLLVEGRQLLAASDRLHVAVNAAAAERRPIDIRVTLGLQAALASQLEALQNDPLLDVNLTMTSGIDAEDAVATGRADAAVVWVSAGLHSTLHTRALGQAEVWIALPVGHRLAALDAVPLHELADENIALFPRHLSPGVWDQFVQQLLPAGPRPGQVREELTRLHPMEGMLRAVEAGTAIAPFVHVVATEIEPDRVVLRPLMPAAHVSIQLVVRDPARADMHHVASVLMSLPPAYPETVDLRQPAPDRVSGGERS